MDNEAQVLQKFDQLLALTNQYENEHPGEEAVLKLVEEYSEVQRAIIRLHLFSPNEEFEEIHTENLKFFLLPFYVGWALTQLSDPRTRQKNVDSSEYYIQEFLKLMHHYELLDEYQLGLWKKLKQSPKLDRDDKIKNYKEQKQINLQVQNLQKLDDAKQQRQIIKLQLSNKIYHSFDLMVQNAQEKDVLKFKDQLQKDEQFKKQFEQEQQKPVPKMKVWNIPKPSDQPQFFDPVCHNCQSEAELRQQHVAQVWQPNPDRLPNLSLEEFANMEMKMAKDQESKMKAAQEEQQKLEVDKDDDKDYWNDQQTLKDRAWDDWKDAHEKGAGNKMKR